MAERVLAGAAAHNAGQYSIARVVWAGEAPFNLGGDGAADRLLAALTAFATTVTESRRGEWADALDAAARAESALGAVGESDGEDADASVDTGPIERWLTAFRADPEMTERSPPPTLAVAGDRPIPGELPLEAAAVVASAVAAARGDDPAVVADAVRFARQHERPESTRYATFLRDYAGADPGQRPIVFERLSGVVARERRKEDDVDGLFES